MTLLAALSQQMMVWLTESALPLWWERGADHEHGGFHESLDETGDPVAANRRARVQARQIYVYSTAGALGWNGPWRQAVSHGLDFFLSRYQRADGLYRTIVSPEGACIDDSAWLYDQAFALFALAQAAKVMPERSDLRSRARSLMGSIQGWRLPEGGFREPPAANPYQSNPHMHLLEASLAWAEIDDDPSWDVTADEIVSLARSRFIDTNGALHEFFASGWRLAEGIDGRIIEPGHQFEWAWLLARWARLRGDEGAQQTAARLFDVGKSGIDSRRGVATQQLLEDGSVYDDVARLWPQTEWIKAAIIFQDRESAASGIAGLNIYLNKPIAGLWFDKCRSDGSLVSEPSPASSFYHIVCALAELRAEVGD